MKSPVTRQTLAKWLKLTLTAADIDTTQFQAHSYRGGLSFAHRHGASLEQIISHGYWANTETFKRHYFAPANTSPIGKIILENYKKGLDV